MLMLVEFSVGNYLSFKDISTFSMVASNIKEHRDTNIFQGNKYFNLLKSSVIYGSNASGKSNLFKAMDFMRQFSLYSSNYPSKKSPGSERIKVENFKLSTETKDQPSYFEIVFIKNGVKYRYGFQVDTLVVKREWLFYAPKKKEHRLFFRNENSFEIDAGFEEGKGLEGKTRKDALFLSIVGMLDGKISREIFDWFENFKIITNLHSAMQDYYYVVTSDLLEDEEFKHTAIQFLQSADLGIEDIEVSKMDIQYEFLPENMQQPIRDIVTNVDYIPLAEMLTTEVFISHKKYDENKNVVGLEKFDLRSMESHGTKKLFSLLGPMIFALETGGILAVDELDASLHSLITKFIIDLFNSKQYNENNAQLIFNTHDTNLLSNKILRRDQIWFSEKNRYGATDLYSLAEFKIRNDASFQKSYLQGKFGSIPFVDQLSLNEEKN